MRITPSSLDDVYVVETDPISDDRGEFARLWCEDTLASHGLQSRWVQMNWSRTRRAGTIRGLHVQASPHAEAKLVRCTHGAVFDVVVDVRAHSPTFGKWVGAELSDHNQRSLYVPEGFAHGFQALQDEVEVIYLVSQPYRPDYELGFRYDEPLFGIEWPVEVAVISRKDLAWPLIERR